MIKNCIQNIDRKKAFEMLIGVIGIYLSFLVNGVMYEKITNVEYLNTQTGQHQYFRLTSGFVMIERAINWWLGLIYQYFTLPKEQRVIIPTKNSAAVGFLIWLSTIAMTESMYLVSYPLIVMAKSCGLISVILVGVCCSRVRSKQLKLSPQKIIIATIVTAGILMFRLFDPKANFESGNSTELLGLFFLLISLFTDGFIPDFQAQIKDKYKPSPIEMLIKINKWCAIFAAVHLLVMAQFKDFFFYCLYHPDFVWDLLILSLSAFIGQLFVYRMIKEFKQHMVPFVITTRKIFTVGLSIVYFHHETSIGQILAIIVVFIVTFYEFMDNITKVENPVLRQKKQPDQYELAQTTQNMQSSLDRGQSKLVHELERQKSSQ